MFLFQDAAPAMSPWMDPRFLLSAAGVLVLVAMAIARLEFKTNANGARQKDFEVETTEEFKAVRKEAKEDSKAILDELKEERQEHREWKRQFYAHATDTKLHHNEEMFKEFRSGIDRRFTGVESTLQDISRKLDGGDRGIHKTQG